MDKNRFVSAWGFLKITLMVVWAMSLVGLLSRGSMACHALLSDGCLLHFHCSTTEIAGDNCGSVNPGHSTSNTVNPVTTTQGSNLYYRTTDSGGWAYFYDPNDKRFGQITVNCGHRDRKRKLWLDN